MPKYTVQAAFTEQVHGRVWFDHVEADSPEEARRLVQKNPNNFERYFKPDGEDGTRFFFEDCEVFET